MRHMYIRGILALIWLAAAIVSGISGNLEMAVLYVLMGGAFAYTAVSAWRKMREKEGGEQENSKKKEN